MQTDGIDHVHIEVKNREVAAHWYHRILGLNPDVKLADWAKHSAGPLILSTASSTAVLALFARESKQASRDATIAFWVSGLNFITFVEKLDRYQLTHISQRMLIQSNVVDHRISQSIYFLDRDNNRIEVTTYDYALVAATGSETL